MKNSKFDKILNNFEPLSEIEKMDEVSGGKLKELVAKGWPTVFPGFGIIAYGILPVKFPTTGAASQIISKR